MSVKVTANKDGIVVTPFSETPEYGFIIIKSTEMVFLNGWFQPSHRSTLLRGKTADLKASFSEGQTLPGKIVISECLSNAIPDSLRVQLNKKKTGAEQLEQFLKRAGTGGPVLMVEGVPILSFSEYDPSGSQADVNVAHDNKADIVAHNNALAKKEAKLPE